MAFKNRTSPDDALPAGRLSDLLTFQVLTSTKDGYGPPVESWATSFTCAGEYQPLGSREFPESQKRYTESTARFVIRYRSGIHAGTHQILFDGLTWNVTEPIHDRRRIMTIIEASIVA